MGARRQVRARALGVGKAAVYAPALPRVPSGGPFACNAPALSPLPSLSHRDALGY